MTTTSPRRAGWRRRPRPAVSGRPRVPAGLTLERAHELTRIDPWFLHHIHSIALAERDSPPRSAIARRSSRATSGSA
ncbi:MAG: hypothetical protein WKG01_23965 [Kofleriaceae bacterium]